MAMHPRVQPVFNVMWLGNAILLPIHFGQFLFDADPIIFNAFALMLLNVVVIVFGRNTQTLFPSLHSESHVQRLAKAQASAKREELVFRIAEMRSKANAARESAEDYRGELWGMPEAGATYDGIAEMWESEIEEVQAELDKLMGKEKKALPKPPPGSAGVTAAQVSSPNKTRRHKRPSCIGVENLPEARYTCFECNEEYMHRVGRRQTNRDSTKVKVMDRPKANYRGPRFTEPQTWAMDTHFETVYEYDRITRLALGIPPPHTEKTSNPLDSFDAWWDKW